MRKGRCSNNPSDCSFSASGKLLPFAGPGSICPECGAPLAMVASTETDESAPAFSGASSQSNTNRREYEDQPNQALEFAKIAAMIAVLGAGMFFGFKFLNKNNSEMVENSPAVVSNAVAVPTIEEINPSQIARLSAPTDIKSGPDAGSTTIAQFPSGAVFDVTGRVSSNGIDWARITIPNQANVGFVEISKLMGVSGTPFILGNMIAEPTLPPEPVVSAISEMPETIYYISSTQANLRAQASAVSEKVGAAVLGDTISVTGKRTVDGKTWYRINLPSGGEGWVNGTLVSKTKPAPPPPEEDKTTIPDAKAEPIAEGAYVVITSDKAKIVPEIGGETAIEASVQKGMAVQIQAIQEVDGKTWYQVRSKRFNIDGWVPSTAVKPVN